ncbi:MAG TPA: hypothetical protein EYN66_14510 [Myxococcales bacterium]|nr:hypothetical protein [Myxococcales bacterium]
MARRGEKALKKQRESLDGRRAALLAAEQGDRLTALCEHEVAEASQKEAIVLRHTKDVPEMRAGGEVAPEPSGAAVTSETLLNPDAVSIGASAQRLALLEITGVSEIAVDAAETISAANSLEKMLAHQLALCHDTAFKTMHQASERPDNVPDQTRLINSATRLLKCYQDGLLALHKIRSGNRQTMVVQHVNVSDGGQAVVTGEAGHHLGASTKNDR